MMKFFTSNPPVFPPPPESSFGLLVTLSRESKLE